MGTQEVHTITNFPMIMAMARSLRPDSNNVDPASSREPFSLESGNTGSSWWVIGGVATLILGAAAGAGYWFWYRPRQAAQIAEEG
jgi:hypothetical protein